MTQRRRDAVERMPRLLFPVRVLIPARALAPHPPARVLHPCPCSAPPRRVSLQHPVCLDDIDILVSSDYPHYLRLALEASLNATVLFFNGIEGDVNPRGEGSAYDKAESYGNIVASAVLASLPAQEEVTGTPQVVYTTQYYRHPVTNVYFLAALRVGMLPDYIFNEEDRTFDLQVPWRRGGREIDEGDWIDSGRGRLERLGARETGETKIGETRGEGDRRDSGRGRSERLGARETG